MTTKSRDDTYLIDYIERVTKERPINHAKIVSWETPATSYPLATLGRAAIEREPYTFGVYCAYGARNDAGQEVDFFTVARRKPLPITALKIAGDVWMVDDPPHWWMIRQIAAKLRGRVLVGGLGLGLMLHALMDNPNVGEVMCVERDPDVIKLVGPLVDGMARIVEADVREYIREDAAFDSSFIDLWVTHGTAEGREAYQREVVPLAAEICHRTRSAPVYALGFTGDRPVVGFGS